MSWDIVWYYVSLSFSTAFFLVLLFFGFLVYFGILQVDHSRSSSITCGIVPPEPAYTYKLQQTKKRRSLARHYQFPRFSKGIGHLTDSMTFSAVFMPSASLPNIRDPAILKWARWHEWFLKKDESKSEKEKKDVTADSLEGNEVAEEIQLNEDSDIKSKRALEALLPLEDRMESGESSEQEDCQETCHWLNAMLKLLVKHYLYSDVAKKFLCTWFYQKAALRLPNILSDLALEELDFYFTFPKIHQIETLEETDVVCGVPSLEEGNEPREEECWYKIDFSWEKVACLGFTCNISLGALVQNMNLALYLPIQLEVDLHKCAGQIFIVLGKRGISVSLHPEFILTMDIRTQIGHTSKLKDIFKISEFLAWKLDCILLDKIVFPAFYPLAAFDEFVVPPPPEKAKPSSI